MATLQEVREDFIAAVQSQLIANNVITSNDINTIYNAVQNGQVQTTLSSQGQVVVFQNTPQLNNEAEQFISQVAACLLTDDPDVYNDWDDTYITSWIDVGGVNNEENYLEISIISSTTETSCGPPKLYQSLALNLMSNESAQTFVMQPQQRSIDATSAQDILDTEIFELYPGFTGNQEKVNQLFDLWDELKPPVPEFDDLGDLIQGDDTTYDQPDVDLNQAGSVSSNPSTGLITRLEDNVGFTDNQNQTLESLHGELQQYFSDAEMDVEDARPQYEERSAGYLKIRNLNHAIIIRNEEGDNTGVENWHAGFTITMWCKFLDKTNAGTLFNYGNPFRFSSPHGFTLDTIIENEQRYVRLSVKEQDQTLRDSHVGITNFPKIPATTTQPNADTTQYMNIPIDFDEWFFIVATYDNSVDESANNTYADDPNYWMGNITALGDPIHYSQLGNRCKVEIISKTDLLKARGFKV